VRTDLSELYPAVKEKIIRVRWKKMIAGAVWQKQGNRWRCVFSPHELRWMAKSTPEQARRRLEAMGAKWEWLEQD
jgi:hypothetical protein